MSWLSQIGDQIAAKLIPIAEAKGQQLLNLAEAKAQELLPKIIDTINAEIEKRIPALTAALVTAVAQAVSGAVVRAEDKVTDIIPGPLDDAILDPIVKNAMDIFNG